MPSRLSATPMPHSSNAPRSSWFNFRSERASRLSVLGIIVAVAALILATIYAVDTFRLARWTSEKDYQIYCQSLLSTSQQLPSDCAPIVHATLPPPPFHSTDYFLDSIKSIKRSIQDRLSRGNTGYDALDPSELGLYFFSLAMMIIFHCFLMSTLPWSRLRHGRLSYSVDIARDATLSVAGLTEIFLLWHVLICSPSVDGWAITYALCLFVMVFILQGDIWSLSPRAELLAIVSSWVILNSFLIHVESSKAILISATLAIGCPVVIGLLMAAPAAPGTIPVRQKSIIALIVYLHPKISILGASGCLVPFLILYPDCWASSPLTTCLGDGQIFRTGLQMAFVSCIMMYIGSCIISIAPSDGMEHSMSITYELQSVDRMDTV